MRTSHFSEEQIIGYIQRASRGEPIKELCRQAGVTEQTFYRWRQKYGGMDGEEARRLKALEVENKRLKDLVVELTLVNKAFKEIIDEGNGPARSPVAKSAGASKRRPV